VSNNNPATEGTGATDNMRDLLSSGVEAVDCGEDNPVDFRFYNHPHGFSPLRVFLCMVVLLIRRCWFVLRSDTASGTLREVVTGVNQCSL